MDSNQPGMQYSSRVKAGATLTVRVLLTAGCQLTARHSIHTSTKAISVVPPLTGPASRVTLPPASQKRESDSDYACH